MGRAKGVVMGLHLYAAAAPLAAAAAARRAPPTAPPTALPSAAAAGATAARVSRPFVRDLHYAPPGRTAAVEPGGGVGYRVAGGARPLGQLLAQRAREVESAHRERQAEAAAQLTRAYQEHVAKLQASLVERLGALEVATQKAVRSDTQALLSSEFWGATKSERGPGAPYFIYSVALLSSHPRFAPHAPLPIPVPTSCIRSRRSPRGHHFDHHLIAVLERLGHRPFASLRWWIRLMPVWPLSSGRPLSPAAWTRCGSPLSARRTSSTRRPPPAGRTLRSDPRATAARP